MINNGYQNIKTLKIKSCHEDFNQIITEVNRLTDCPQVTIGIDHTGGHYSAPLLHFLYQQGYTIYYLEPKGFKTLKKNLLGIDNKTDSLDAICMARLLWMRDTTGDNYRFSTTQPDKHSIICFTPSSSATVGYE